MVNIVISAGEGVRISADSKETKSSMQHGKIPITQT